MEIKLPIGIVILVDDQPLKTAPGSTDSCAGCALTNVPCDCLCAGQDLIFMKTNEPFKEEV